MSETYWARGDSANANNSWINSENANMTPVTELTFVEATGGDLVLEYNDGDVDPDTYVVVDGVQMEFTVEFSGTLPNTNKFSDIAGEDMRGASVVVVTTEDGQRYWFTTGPNSEAIMADMPNGSIPIDGHDTVTDIVLCFGAGTAIAVPGGTRPVEEIGVGDPVLTRDGREVAVRWTGRTRLSAAEIAARPHLAPITIGAHAFGPGRPARPLTLSPQHRVLVTGWLVELHLGMSEVLVPATHLPHALRAPSPGRGADYVHLLLDRHEILVSEGLPSESFHPGAHAVAGLGASARAELLELFPELAGAPERYGPSCRATTRRHEGVLVA